MAYKPKQQNRTPNDTMPDSYYQSGVKGFLSAQGLALHSAANWRFFACAMLCLNLVLMGVAGYFAVRSTIIPYIVEVDSNSGAVISTSKVLAKSQANTKQYEYFIWQIIRKTRVLPKDLVLYQQNWNDAYTFLTSETSQKMNDMAIRENHQQHLKDGDTTSLTLKSITPVSNQDNTYNVRWNEVRYDPSGKKIGEFELEGFFTVEQGTLDEKTMFVNPLGIKVKDFSISQAQ